MNVLEANEIKGSPVDRLNAAKSKLNAVSIAKMSEADSKAALNLFNMEMARIGKTEQLKRAK